MNGRTHQALASSLEVLIGGEGSLPMRLFVVASAFTTISPRAFDDDPCLRSWFETLRDDFVMMGLVNDGPDGPVIALDPNAAMTLALRVVEFIHAVATEDEDV
jgi:hypothetical protein